MLRYIRELGIETASADEVVAQVWSQPETPAVLAEQLGRKQPLQKAEAQSLAFQNPSMRREIEAYFHPLVLDALLSSSAQFVEIPLLVEACLAHRFDAVWVVTCGEQEQRKRLLARVGDPEKVDRVLDAQIPTSVKVWFADRVIRTNRPERSVKNEVAEAVCEAKLA